MENIKLLLFDIDGTLVPYGTRAIPQNTIDAIAKAHNKEYKVAVATGRCFYIIQDNIRKAIPADYFVTINGACLNNAEGKVLDRFEIPEKDVNEFIKMCDEYQAPMAFKCVDKIVAYSLGEEYERRYFTTIDKGNIFVDDSKNRTYLKENGMPSGIFLFADEVVAREMEKKLPNFIFAHARDNGYDVLYKGVTKCYMSEHILKQLNLTWDNVLAVGDAENDIEMIKRAKIGVAIGDGSKKLQEIADYVTASSSDDGITKALVHYNII